MSSLANAGLTVVLAKTISPVEYGAFALAFAVYSLVISLAQAVGGQVVVIKYSDASLERQALAGRDASGAVLVLGTGAAVVTASAALLVSMGAERQVLLAVGVLLPALALQDAWRTIFIARGSPRAAFLNGLSWVALQAVVIGGLVIADVAAGYAYILAWGGAALVAAVIGVRQHGRGPSFHGVPRWFAENREVSVPSLVNAIAILGTTQVALFVIAAVGSVEDVGALRAAQTLLGPLNIVGIALASFAVPEIVRRRATGRALRVAAVGLSGVMAVIVMIWGGVLLLLPNSVGESILGPTWSATRSVLPAMVAFTLLTSATTGASAVMRALNRVHYNLAIALILGPCITIFASVGAVLGGATGAALGFMIAAGTAFIPSWVLLFKVIRLGRRVEQATEAHTATTQNV